MSTLFLEQVLNGLQLGVILFLMAAGLTLIFGIMNFVNLAHGSLFMIGAYLSVAFQLLTGSFVVAFVLAAAGTFAVGAAIEVMFARHLYHRDHLDQVLCTFGLILFFNELVRIIWGPEPLYSAIPPFLAGRVELIPGAPYPVYRLAVIAVGIATAVGLYILVSHTRLGMLIRAGASNRTMIGVLGVNIRAIYTVIFAVGSMLAGIAGVMAGPILTVSPGMGDNILILALVVLIIGGLGSIKGAFIAAILVGVIDTLGRAYLKSLAGLFLSAVGANTVAPALASMLIYLLMAVVLYFKPEGLLAPRGVRLGAPPPPPPASAPGIADRAHGLLARWRFGLLVAMFVYLALLPAIAAAFGQPFWLDLVARIMIFAIAALSLDLILGYTGLVSFGHAAFLGVGAYAVGILAHHGVLSGFVQWPVAILASAAVAFVIGAISLRTSGVFFIMITLAFAQMLYYVGASLYDYGGDDGLSLPSRSRFGGLIDLGDSTVFYYVVYACLCLSLLFSHRLVWSHFGMVMRGSRSNPRRMEAIGFPTFRYRLTAFVIAGAMCGLAGVLLANSTEFVNPQYMHWTRSGEVMIMVIFGGIATLVGPIIGTFVYLGIEKHLSDVTKYWPAIFGPMLIVVVMFAKAGLYSLFTAPSGSPSTPQSLPRWLKPFSRPSI